MDALSRLDNIAYIRFASVYKDFGSLEDLKDFVATIEKLILNDDNQKDMEND